ncbi:MAG TPA: ankyrin repeat domain-containing protein [Acidobacteriaceae bacterium]|nr:ankyrin repeat domain-containing protein [Acidobacteriaceae bacterium]
MSVPGSNPPPVRRLTEHPSLEQLRKQAKELLQEFRSGAPSAIAEVNRFERIPDKNSFALNDAQRVLARAYGFASWPKLKAFVDGANIARFAEAVQAGDVVQVRTLLASRPELVATDRAANDEHRGLHYAVLRRDAAMVRLLMEAGADARKGIYPHRDATSALTLARERHYDDIVAVIEEEERHRREEMSCSNATVSPMQDQISAAIAQADDATAMQLLDQDRTLIHACDRDGWTPLHMAARRNRVELVAWLLEKRANVRKKDPNDLTPLDHAALGTNPGNDRAERFPRVAALLLEHGAVLTVRAAVALGDLPRVRQFIVAEPDLLGQITSSGGLLTLAVNHRQLGSAELLLDLGADVDERILLGELEEPTPSWGMPLWHAAFAGDLAMTKLLLDRCADPNANVYASGWPLSRAWGHADDRVKNLLLERGAKKQPYMVAATHDVEEARRLLAEAPNEELARELAWSAAGHGCPEIVAMAISHLDWRPKDARWHWVLIQPIRDAGGNSAQNDGHFRSLEVLLKHGVDANVHRRHETALHFTAARQSELSGEDRARFAAMLIDHGARFDIRDDLLQSTPLGWACRWGHKELVERLIQRGAPVRESNAEVWATPEAWARKMGHGEILAILKHNSQ